jgi:hypothetical protein
MRPMPRNNITGAQRPMARGAEHWIHMDNSGERQGEHPTC